MQEKNIRQKVYRTLRENGLWPITQTDSRRCRCGRLVTPPIGRPDILILNPIGMSSVTEVKAVRPSDTSWPKNRLTDQQRAWLDRWMEADGLGFLTIGVIRAGASRHRLKGLYCIPWKVFKDWESSFSHRKSIPVDAFSDMEEYGEGYIADKLGN